MNVMIANPSSALSLVTDFCRPLTLPDRESERPTRPLFDA
jgi:hypothetical protein